MLSRRFHGMTLALLVQAAPLAALGVLTSPELAHAADAASELEQAEQAYTSLDFAAASASASAVLTRGKLSHEQLIRATRVQALSAAALDKPEQAKEAFVCLLAYDPDYTVDARLGPRYREPFNEARGYWAAQSSKPGIETQVMVSARAPGNLRVLTRDPARMVDRVVVAYRWAPASQYVTTSAAAGDAQVDVPAPPAGSTRLDYYVLAEDKAANVVFATGSAGSPKFSVVPAEAVAGGEKEKRSVFASPIFWAVAGVLVVGAATTTYFVANQGSTSTVVSNQWSPTLMCGGARCE